MDRTKAGLALCLFAAAVAAVPARAQTALGAPRSYTGVHGVRDLVDLNGDGLLDVVGIQSNDDVVVVLFGDRALGFTLPVTVVGDDWGWPQDCAAGDFDEDGAIDLAVVSMFQDNRFSIFLGDGSGGFPNRLDSALLTRSSSIDTGDFNGDGHLDLGAAQSVFQTSYSELSVLFGDGDGQFTAPTLVLSAQSGIRLVAADFNDDGRDDMAITTFDTPHVEIFLSNASGVPVASSTVALGTTTTSPIAADWNEDGHVDLAVIAATPGGGKAVVAWGDGVGGFPSSYELPVAPGDPGPMAAADFDRDGHLDVAVHEGTEPSSFAVVLGDGAGSFSASGTFDSGARVLRLFAADLDGDGWIDLGHSLASVFQGPGAFRVHAGDGRGAFDHALATSLAEPDSVDFAAGDFDANGSVDFVSLGEASGELRFNSGSGDGTFLPGVLVTASSGYRDVASANVDADAFADLVAARPAGTIDVYRGIGGGAFAPGGSTGVPANVNDVAAIDLNGDGIPDLATLHGATIENPLGSLSTRMRDEFGVFGPLANVSAAESPRSFVWADYDSDGDLDVAVVKGSGAIVISLENDGSGALTSAGSVTLPDHASLIVTADFDGDGRLDLAAKGSSDGSNTVHLFRGDGSLGFMHVRNLGQGRNLALAATDLDGDGVGELLLSDDRSVELAVLSNGVLTGTQTRVEFGCGVATHFEFADLDSDGRSDVLCLGPAEAWALLDVSHDPIRVRRGNVNAGAGPIVDVLFFNGSAGVGAERRVDVDRFDPYALTIVAPPWRPSGPVKFAVFKWVGTGPITATVRKMPQGLGYLGLPHPLGPPPYTILPKHTWNNIGRFAEIGQPSFPSTPAPSEIIARPEGIGKEVVFYYQGFVLDRNARNRKASITNGITVVSH